LEQWLNERPDWLRRAAADLITAARAPIDDEIELLADHCHVEAAEQLEAPHPPIEEGAIATVPGGGELRIQKISAIRGVNALGSNAELQLDQGSMTVIYGINGSGKTGYVRLLKELCGSRVRDKAIYPNVFAGETVEPSATVILTNNGEAQEPVEWKASDGALRKLASVQVFDTLTAVQYCDTAAPATHEPRTMRFVGLLIKTADRVAEVLRHRRASLISTMPEMPAALLATAAGGFYRSIKATTTPSDITAACQISADAAQERVALEGALAQSDPATRLVMVRTELDRIGALRTEVVKLQTGFGDDAINSVMQLRATAIQKRATAREYAEKFFAGVPLLGVGEVSWRELWRHAATYSETLAYPDHSHPNIEEGARCVLCQQILSVDAKARLQNFHAYITNSLETEAITAERAVVQREEELPAVPLDTHWNVIGAATGMTAEELAKVECCLKARIEALRANVPQAAIPSVDWTGINTAIAATIHRLTAEQDNLKAVSDPDGRAKQTARLMDLKGREWIATVHGSMIHEADRQRRLKILDRALSLTNTASLTQKSNEIGAVELAGGYKDRFNKELHALRGNQLPVQLEHKKEGKGKFTFFIELRDVHGMVASRTVLSEGEQRVVAIAAFLADATANDRSTPLIFDDPISSLDQSFEEAVATRLIALARTRQVIVFTHRLSLMTLLDDAKKKLKEAGMPISFHVEVITRDGAATGVHTTLDVFSEAPMAGLNKLIAAINGIKQADPLLQKLAAKGICSNFRIVLERIVENHLCAGVVLRFRRDIQTKNKIARLASVRAGDCQLIDAMMTKYSAFEHSQSVETPTQVPDAGELLADIEAVKEWLTGFLARLKEEFG
jgi:energy-coupling factor transporter ATP-binding protein EcfA2